MTIGAPERTRTLEALPFAVVEVERDYSAFFRSHYGAVLRTVSLLMRDPFRAEEVTQDAFMQLLRNWPKISRYDQPQSWVRRVAIRLAMRSIRRQRLIAFVTLDAITAAAPEAGRADLLDAVRQLPGAQRAAIVLHYYEDRPVKEIAVLIGCSESTARVHLHRGRRRLQSLLGEVDDDV